MVLVFTDIVRSVDLKQKHGDSVAAALIARHDAIFKGLMKTFVGAHTIKDTGDGYLAEFPTTSDAVRFALRFQHAVATEDWGDEPLRVRIGVHLGEVSELDLEEATGKSKLSGLAVDLTARVMGLAAPNQILLTRAAFDGARQYIRLHPLAEDGEKAKNLALKWMAHGSYIFQGSEDPMEVFEVGPESVAPLIAPPDSEKARRSVAAEDEETLGWRPAAGLPIPMRSHWTLDHKLGEGGFGEVWLGMHERTGERRVFKFCFDAEKLRSLKRELVLFRLLRQVLGDRADIAKLYEVQLDEPPFFLESEFTEDGSLIEWSKNQGGLEKVALPLRLDLIIRTAEAVAAAHSVGVLHKDIKPGNILIYRAEDGSFRPRLTDFGIGVLTDLAKLNTGSMTISDLNVSVLTDSSSDAGTRMYSPPELLVGRPFTIQGDVYSLGVMLYQMVVGDFERPIAQGWERDVSDPLLREDISRCIEGHEQDRLASAKELAERLRTLPQRKKARVRKRAARLTGYASVILIVLLGISVLLMARERQLRLRAERAEQTTEEVNSFMNNTMANADPWEDNRRDVTLAAIVKKAGDQLETEGEFADRPEIESELRATIGRILRARGMRAEARPHLERALALRRELHDGDNADVAESLYELAAWNWESGQFEEARPLYEESLAMRQRLFGPQHALIADSLNHLAACYDKLGRSDDARKYYLEALDMRRKLFGEVHEDVAASLNNYATYLRNRGEYEEAEKNFRKSLEIIIEVRGPDHPIVAFAMHTLATSLMEQDKLAEAREWFEKSIDLKRRTFPMTPPHPSLASSLTKLAQVIVLMGSDDLDHALELADEALTIRRGAYKEGDLRINECVELVALINLKLGRLDDADPMLTEAIALSQKDPDGRGGPYDEIGHMLGAYLISTSQFDYAEPIMLSVLGSTKNSGGTQREAVLLQLVSMYQEWQKPDRAAVFQSQLATRKD